MTTAADVLAVLRAAGCRPFVGDDGFVYCYGDREVVAELKQRYGCFESGVAALLQEHAAVPSASDVVLAANALLGSMKSATNCL